MQNLLRNFMKCSRASFMPQPMLHYLTKETIYSSQQKVLVREPEKLLPFTANHLWDNDGSRRTARRLGRGPGSSKGKTAGRGIKGRLARKGGSTKLWFEGGQTPLQDRLPKWGFSRVNTDIFNYINIGQLIYFIKKGRLDKNKTITIRDMYEAGAFKKVKYGVKVLSRGLQNLDFPLNLEVSDASASVIKAIKEKGGSVKCVYRTSLKMKEHIKPYKFPFELEDPLPTPKMVMRMERIRERGAEVVYNQPDWVKKQFEEGKKILKENAQLNGFQIPADRSPGVGANKIRKRRQRFVKEIKYDIDKH